MVFDFDESYAQSASLTTAEEEEIQIGSFNIKDVEFKEYEIIFTFWDTNKKIMCSEHGAGYRWLIIYPSGYRVPISKKELLQVFGYYTFLDGIHKLWLHSFENAKRERAQYLAELKDAEAKSKAKVNKLIGKLIQKSDPAEVPESLKHISELKQLKADVMQCIVYFLVKKNTVVYVGQTKSEWPGRIREHIKDNGKDFDQVFYIHVPNSQTDETEKFYINQFKPKYNKKLY